MDRRALEALVYRHLYLRGLHVVPWGIGVALVLGLVPMLRAMGAGRLTGAWFPVLLAIGIAESWISRYYARTQGTASVSRSAPWRHGVAAPALVALTLAGLWCETRLHGDVPGVPAWFRHTSALAVGGALGMLAWHRLHVGRQQHDDVLWGGLVALGLLPVWGWGAFPNPTSLALHQAWLMLGGALVLGGVLDHRVLPTGLAPQDDDPLLVGARE